MAEKADNPRIQVGVIGPGEATSEQTRMARAVGRLIAEAGAVLLCGGRTGVMEAAARGAKEAGGLTVGILPGDAEEANPAIEVIVATGLGEARNAVLVRSCAAVIAVGGAFGTLSEIALALKLGVPVVLLRSWRFVPPDGRALEILTADTPEAAVRLALIAARAAA